MARVEGRGDMTRTGIFVVDSACDRCRNVPDNFTTGLVWRAGDEEVREIYRSKLEDAISVGSCVWEPAAPWLVRLV